jgi:hypothetical protein
MGERCNRTAEVRGSIPLSSTTPFGRNLEVMLTPPPSNPLYAAGTGQGRDDPNILPSRRRAILSSHASYNQRTATTLATVTTAPAIMSAT